MANLQDIDRRIVSVKKTRQITSAMKVVSVAKLKKATSRAEGARPYQDKLAATLARVAASAGPDASAPLMAVSEHVKKIEVIVLTTDRGLCGAFNNGLLRRLDDWLKSKKAEGIEVKLRVYGRKGVQFLSVRGHEVHEQVTGYSKTAVMDLVRPLCEGVVTGFVDTDIDETWLMSNEFVNKLVQRPTFNRILPLGVQADEPDAVAPQAGGDYRYEPGADDVLGALLPLYLRTIVLQAFLETEAGEYAARMTAMDNASRNASDLIDKLSLQYNRARQAAITTEIIEIVSGAEALA